MSLGWEMQMSEHTSRSGATVRIAAQIALNLLILLNFAVAQRDPTTLEHEGRFTDAQCLLRALIDTARGVSPAERTRWAFEIARLDRIRMDYSLTEDLLFAQLERSIKDVTRSEMKQWMAEGRFDVRTIDGRAMFLGVSRSNLFWRYPDIAARRIHPPNDSAYEASVWKTCTAIKNAAAMSGKPYVLPKQFRVVMTVTVDSNAAPDGETIRAWLPVPRAFPHQHNFRLLTSSPSTISVAPAESPIRSAYLEAKGVQGAPTVFRIEYEYTSEGVRFAVDPAQVRQAALQDSTVKLFVKEGPHVVFTEAMKKLSAEIAGKERNPLAKARMFYDWIAENIKYSYAREYSTIPDLGGYCLEKRYGDCGQETFLYITLCRLNGIPARWQSGWFTFPGGKTIHDWCEIYLLPYGWIPVDPYMGIFAMQYMKSLSREQCVEVRDFYFGGLDQYRIAANSDHCQTLDPLKRSFRSDNVDFQRGELEYGNTNIYFDKYSYELTISEL